MNDFAQTPQPPPLRHSRRRGWWRWWPRRVGTSRVPRLLLLLVVALGGTLLWWWGPWRKWDVRIQFLGFEDAGGERVASTNRGVASFAVFEMVNRSGEDLLVPYLPEKLTYEVWSPDGKSATFAPSRPGSWVEVEAGGSTRAKVPLRCPDGTPITGTFRVGFEFSDMNGIRRRIALDRQPGWAKHWIYKVLPRSFFRSNTRMYWTERVTP